MTTADRTTLHSLNAELIQANSKLSDAQGDLKFARSQVDIAITRRDLAEANLDKFLNSVSDAPAEPLKRKYVRKAKELLASAPNAAQPTVEVVRERLNLTEVIGEGTARNLNRGGTASLSGLLDESAVGE